jgi:hypothetical protein
MLTTGNTQGETTTSGVLGVPDHMNAAPAEGEFKFYKNPWVSGTRANSYYGGVEGRSWCKSSKKIDVTLDKALMRLAKKAVKLDPSANACVGLEIIVDLWHEKPNGDIVVQIVCRGVIAEVIAL